MPKPDAPSANTRLTRGALYMITAAFFFSLMSAMVKIAGQRLPTQELVFARAVIGLALSWWMIRRIGISPWGVRKGLLTARGVMGTCGMVLYFWALSELPIADATVIMYTNPVWTAVFAAIFLGERLSSRVVLGCVGALIGVVLVAQPAFIFGDGPGLPTLPALAALAGAMFAGGAYTAVRAARRTEHPLVVVLYFPLIAAPVSGVAMVPDAVLPVGSEWLLLLGIGLTVQIAQVFMTKGLHLEPAGRATAISYVNVVFAFIWGVAFFGEAPTLLGVAGALLVSISALSVALGRAAKG